MDTYCEQMVIRKKTPKILLMQLGIWVLSIALGAAAAFGLLNFAASTGFSMLFVMALVVLGGTVYYAYKFSCLLYVEYEYSLTNGCFDIDKIIAKSRRVRLISSACRDIEAFGRYREEAHAEKQYAKRIMAAGDMDSDSLHFAVVRQPETGKVLVVFEPDSKTLDAIKKYIPRQVLNAAI